ncbi:unnamed protein product [Prorocentrum cordatum]|nr:unnamed protein product [Polarella glacialis]
MNELAGLCFYVVRHGEHAGMGGLGARLCGRVHNEADTYALFGEIMERGGLREMFAIVRAKPAAKAKAVDVGPMPGMARVRQGPARQPISAVLARCKHIFHNVLKQVDVQLHAYLVEKGVEPQIFLLRWIRLLFCREFHVADTVALWTMIFADAGSVEARDAAFIPYAAADAVDREGVQAAEAASRALPLVDFFAVAMIEFLRMQLLSMDESECLQRLMKFPPVENVATLITLAKRLRAGEAAPIPQLPPPPAPEPTPNPPPQPLPLFLAGSPVRAASQGERPTDAAASPGPADKGSPAVPAPAPVAAAAQDVLRGIISAGRQAVEAGIARAGPGEGTGQARQSRDWGRVDLWSGGGGADASSASPQRVAQLEQQVKALEQEKEQLKAKARQFLAAKTQELRDKVAELEGRLRDAEAAGAGPVEAAADGEAVALQDRVARLEAALAAARLEGQRASEAAAAEAAARAAAEEDARGSLRRAEAAERKAAQLAAALEALRRAPGPAQAQSVAPAPAGMPPPEAAEPAVGAADAEAPVPADRPPPDAAAAAELGAEAAEAEAAAPAGSAAPTESAPAESAEVAAAELTADAAAPASSTAVGVEVGDLM